MSCNTLEFLLGVLFLYQHAELDTLLAYPSYQEMISTVLSATLFHLISLGLFYPNIFTNSFKLYEVDNHSNLD